MAAGRATSTCTSSPALAFAEVGWTARERRDSDDFVRRQRAQAARLDALGVARAK